MYISYHGVLDLNQPLNSEIEIVSFVLPLYFFYSEKSPDNW